MAESAKKAGGKAGRSLQSKLLRRRLSVKLALNWVVYTIAFALLALLLNATVVPRIADEVADSTSEWDTYDYADFPLERCLSIMGMELVGATATMEEADLMAWYIEARGDDALKSMGIDWAPADESSKREIVVSRSDLVEAMEAAAAENGYGPDVDLSVMDADDEAIAEVDADVIEADGSREAGYDITSDLSAGFVVKEPDGYSSYNLRGLQQQAIWSVIMSSDWVDPENWQIVNGQENVQARDISAYNAVKQFKIPAALLLYMAGCIALIFVGYGRAMRYFDELSSAVGGLMADREKPVELPPALHLTEDELNSIRLASLADERAAKSAERRKDELVAYLAHDIKTPLTSVMGYLMLLEEAPDMPAEQRQRYVGIAADKAQRLESLIDEFFEITRYNLQAIPIERENVDMGLLLAQVADEFYPDAQARSLSIRVDAPEGETAFVDAGKFARAVGNVVRNAVAYADGGTEVLLSATPAEGEWRVVVRNDGREISEAHLSSIFEKFYREDASRGSGSGGAGLGLAIAKEIVVAHGGTIDAASENGTTTFTIAVPR